MEVYSDETYGPGEKKLTLGRNWKVPVYSRLGCHFFSTWPKHGASPLLPRWQGPPGRFNRAIADAHCGSDLNDAVVREVQTA
jgi:hypothetical protein